MKIADVIVKKPKTKKVKVDFKTFLIPGMLRPNDFNLSWRIFRIQREKVDKKALAKLISEGTKYKGKNPFTPYNSWYYSLNVTCEDFDNNVMSQVKNNVPAKKRKENAKKIQESRSFGVLQALIYAKKGFRYDIPQFVSLKVCQKWCDKNKIKINVYEVYENTKDRVRKA